MIDIIYDSPEVWFNCECGESLKLGQDGEGKRCKCGKSYRLVHRILEIKDGDEAHDPRS